MNIMGLLKMNGYPKSYVQAHHTRLLVYSDGEFEVIARRNPLSTESLYSVVWYRGYDEEAAVEKLIESEES